MKTFIIIGLVVIILFFLFRGVLANREKNREERKKNLSCLTLENYLLIRESPYADELSEYTIYREEHEIKFREEASFFTIRISPPETTTVKLRDLSTHGLRREEFLKYICNLVDKINKKTSKQKTRTITKRLKVF
ncbi:MAG: hypothetical protein L3J06_02960 [Cyclobacteriaceae bacterium]|nr:hypothetical protein [Cyclobacteriaceae bacterium]